MDRVLEILVDLWIYDIETLSSPWVLYPIIPAMFYAAFMMLKWSVVTCPIWLPLVIISKALRGDSDSEDLNTQEESDADTRN